MIVTESNGKERSAAIQGCMAIILKENKVLMLNRKNKFDSGRYSLPGGHIEEDETVKQAIIREVKEETNLDIIDIDLEIVACMHRMLKGRLSIEYFVVVKNFNGELKNIEPEKCNGFDFFGLDSLPKNISDYAAEGLRCYLDGEKFVEFDK